MRKVKTDKAMSTELEKPKRNKQAEILLQACVYLSLCTLAVLVPFPQL